MPCLVHLIPGYTTVRELYTLMFEAAQLSAFQIYLRLAARDYTVLVERGT